MTMSTTLTQTPATMQTTTTAAATGSTVTDTSTQQIVAAINKALRRNPGSGPEGPGGPGEPGGLHQ